MFKKIDEKVDQRNKWIENFIRELDYIMQTYSWTDINDL